MAVCSSGVLLATVCFLVVRLSHAANQTIPMTSSSSGCLCDLTGNACDINCCCDPECSDADKDSFTECVDTDANRDSQVCVSQQVLFKQNIPFRTENTGGGLFCILKDNFEERNFYKDVRVADTKEEFSNLKSQSAEPSYTRPEQQTLSTPSAAYKVGDPVVLVFGNGVQGFLALPKGLLTSECDEQNAAGYLQDDSTECTRRVQDVASQCETEPALAARNFYEGFQVVKNPSLFLSSNNVSSNATNATSSETVNVVVTELVLCDTNLGIPQKCSIADPVYNNQTKTCSNVVTEVTYTVVYSNQTTGQIESVTLAVVLGTVSAGDNPLVMQKFHVKFLKEGEKNTFQRSGNPGYIVGKPLLAGKLQQDSTKEKEAIALSVDSGSWLTLAAPCSSGACLDSSQRVPVTFGVDMRTGCTISVQMNSPSCGLIQETAFNALLGDEPTHVAMFGNSDVNKVDDWVKIINNKPSNEAKARDGAGGCSGLVMGLHIEVLFAQFGFLSNPQPKVVGVQMKYDNRKEVPFQCSGISCQPGNSQRTQSFEVVMSVGFTDVSERPDPQIKPRPTFEAKAASDFFHPFL